EEGDAARRETEEEAGIDEAVGVIEDEEDGTNGGDVLNTGDFDTAKENPQDQSEEGTESGSHYASTPLCLYAFLGRIRPHRSTHQQRHRYNQHCLRQRRRVRDGADQRRRRHISEDVKRK